MKLTLKQRQALDDRDLCDWTDQELLAILTGRYEPSVIPPCQICGQKLSLQAIGGGRPTVWACIDHYDDSRYEDCRHGGDSTVMELIRRYQLKAGSK